MAKSKDTSGVVIIKKYANRRLYDTSTSSYVTLEHLSDLVRKEVSFEVRDAKTGEDLTRQVLTQIIFEKETKGEGALPIDFLRKLIGFYGGGSQSLLPAWLEMSMNSYAESQEKWTKNIGTVTNPFAIFEKQAQANMEIFENTMRMFMASATPSGASKPKKAKKSGASKPQDAASSMAAIPGVNEEAVALLRGQMQAMQAQLDALAGKS
ncbi:MAG: polyhydroxyalkanoate synthesis repressor PhaR [Henriciella sp.]